MQRARLLNVIVVFTIVVLGVWTKMPLAQDALTIVTWGGAYEESQRKAFFQPFTQTTGIDIETRQYSGGLKELREQILSGRVNWDLIDLVSSDNLAACREGLLQPLNSVSLLTGDVENDFHERAITDCGIGQVIFSTVVAFDTRQFTGEKPNQIEHFFDLETFPGKRGLQRKPVAVLEWALMSYGVPKKDIYSLLSTPRGLDLAFKRLDQIKKHIVWWSEPEEPITMLSSSVVSMTSGFNGRFFDARINQGAPIQTIWDGQIMDISTWGIPKGAPHSDDARLFIRFATGSTRLAEITKYISYGPARKSANAAVGKHQQTGTDMRSYLPTFPPNYEKGLTADQEWYSHTQELIEKRFEKWINDK